MGTEGFIVLLVLLTFTAGFFSSTETAFFSLPTTKIKTWLHSSDKKKVLAARLLSHPRDLLVTVFMLNTLSNILLQNTASAMFGRGASWLLKIGVPFILTLIFGEIIPKYIGIQNNSFLTYTTAPAISFIQNLLAPVRKAIIYITEPISRFLFFFLKKEERLSEDEVEYLLNESEKSGVLDKKEAELVKGYLTLQRVQVKEAMRPKEDILFYKIEEPLSKLIYLLVDQQCSKIPVCDEKLDHLLGIISAKTFFLNRDEIYKSGQLLPFLSKPFYVPENTMAPLLLTRFNEKKEEMAIIVDEYGSICGLITYEDLNELVVGDIHDLRDQKKLYTKQSEDAIITNAKLELSMINEIFKSDLKSDSGMVTIAGFLLEKLGEIPKTSEKHEIDGFLFQILSSNPNRIKRVYIRKLKVSK
ncbi:MAG TPA: hemolysin family protein [Parachlamydiaceae bacterium]|nr:hemolysin family protein [Parachlamydiaceae bacterium]